MVGKQRSQMGVVRPLRGEQQQEGTAHRLKHRARATWQKLGPVPA